MSDEHLEYRSVNAVSGEFYFAASIGGTTYIKVVAESLDDALEAAATKVIDDFENAGQLKLADVQLEPLEIDDLGRLLLNGDTIVAETVDLSIIVGGDSYEVVDEDE